MDNHGINKPALVSVVGLAGAYIYSKVLPNLILFTTVAFINRDKQINIRQSDVQPVKDSIQALLKAYRIQSKVNQVQVVASWEKIVGKAIALKTKELYFKEDKLFVLLTSAPLKHQLVMSKTRVIELINMEVGEGVVKEVVFL